MGEEERASEERLSQDDAGRATRVLGLVDLHWDGQRPLRWPDFQDVDLVVLAGDLVNFQGRDTAARLLDSLDEACGLPVLAVCGNCDLPEVEQELRERDIDLDRRARRFGGARFVGVSGGLPFGRCPYERTEGEYRRALAEAWSSLDELDDPENGGPVVLVSHQPPSRTVCDLARGLHVGSDAVRESVEERQPSLVFGGHIHEAVGVDRIGRSLVVNPGPWFRAGVLRFRIDGDSILLEEPAET